MMTTVTWNVMVPMMVTMTWSVVVSMIMAMLWTVLVFCAVVMMMVSVVRMMKMSCMGMISVVTVRTVVSSTSAMASVMVIPAVMMIIIILVVIMVFNRGWMRTVMKTLRPRVASLHATSISRVSGLVMERVCSSMAMVEGLGMGRLGGVGAPAGLLSSVWVFAGATWVCAS